VNSRLNQKTLAEVANEQRGLTFKADTSMFKTMTAGNNTSNPFQSGKSLFNTNVSGPQQWGATKP
jgi:hypothetical protein